MNSPEAQSLRWVLVDKSPLVKECTDRKRYLVDEHPDCAGKSPANPAGLASAVVGASQVGAEVSGGFFSRVLLLGAFAGCFSQLFL